MKPRALQVKGTYLVEWVDSVGNHGWETEASYLSYAKDTSGAIHRSCGFVLASDHKMLSLVQSHVHYSDQADPMVADGISIPWVAILRVQRLR